MTPARSAQLLKLAATMSAVLVLAACGGGSESVAPATAASASTSGSTPGTTPGTPSTPGTPTTPGTPSTPGTPAADTTAPTAPASLQGSINASGKVQLTWAVSTDQGGSGLAGYRIYRGNSILATAIASPGYTDTSVTTGTAYTYSARAYDGAGNESAASNSISITTPVATTPPLPPPSSPPPANSTYQGYVYQLPTTRPFISLDNYNGVSRTSAAYTRLKAQVDDVVVVTNGVSVNATYDQLISALNSGHYGYSATDSVLMFRLSADPKYIQQAIRMVDLFVASENVKIAAGTMPSIASDSYLEVGFFMEQLALTFDYGNDRLTPTQRAAWTAYADQAISNVWNYGSARWGSVSRPWTGWSVNDPGNNYFYSFLKATQLWSLATQNMTWINFLQAQKYPLVVTFFNALTGGGSREGTGYGTAMGNLFENYAYWKGSTGEDLASYSTHARDTIDYWTHATVPTFDYFASIGDQSRSSMPLMFDYQRKLVEEAVSLYPATDQGRRGTWWLNRVKVTDGGSGSLIGRMRYNYNFRYDLLPTATTEQAPTSLVYDTPGVGALFARSDWTTSASWMHTNAGFYDQSHAHKDQGSFSFFKGTWLTMTSNAYSASGINQGVDVHNVIRFMNGSSPISQNESVSTKTYTDSGSVLQIYETLTPAYSRSSGLVSRWLRDFTYDRSQHSLRVHDECTVASGVTPVWQLHVPVLPVRQPDGSYLAGTLRIIPVVPLVPTVSIVNMHTASSEFASGYRLELTAPAGGCEFTVDLRAQ